MRLWLISTLYDVSDHLYRKGGQGHCQVQKVQSYRRHITAHDRLIYDIYDDVVTVLILEVEGHYKDK